MRRPSHLFSRVWLVCGLLFLYTPIVVLVFYSFNASRLVTVWAGFSTQWYAQLFADSQLIGAVATSFEVAIWSASGALVLGTLAAWALDRFGRFRGRTLFVGMMAIPLVMPDVIVGLSLLLLYVAAADLLGLSQQRGMFTIWIAHVTLCTAYVAVVLSARLRKVDRSLEEAAMDLGASPLKTFFVITVPMMASALASAWLLSFTLSFDDLVLASFVSGPGATTLPMVVFSSARLGVSPKINALATLLVLVVSLAALLGWWLLRRTERRQERAAFFRSRG